MASIARLVVSLGANTAKFETDMQRANRNQARRMKEMKQTAAAAAKGIAIAFTAAAGAMTAVVRSSTKTADEMQKMATRLGTTSESLSELSHVADLSGVKFNQLTIGMQRMTRRIAEVAALGKGEAKQALDQLGLSAKKLAELPVDKQFEAVAEELSKVEVQSERVRLAFKLFDSEGVALVQTMGEGAAGIQAMREEARQMGKVISTETAIAAERFNDNLTRMGALAEGAGMSFTAGLLPGLIDVQEYFLSGAQATDIFSKAGEWLGNVIKQLIGSFIVLKHVIEALIRLFISFADIVIQAFKAIVAPITATTQQLAKAFDLIAEGNVKGALQALGNIAESSGKKYTKAVNRMENATQEMADAARHVKKGLDEAVKVMAHTERQAKKTTPAIIKTAEGMTDLAETSDDAEKALEKVREEADEFEQTLQALLDRLNPVQTAGRQLGDELAILERAFNEGKISGERFEEEVRKLTDAFTGYGDETKKVIIKTDRMTEAMLEGTRIIERAFTSMWEDMLSGADSAFDSIADGFKTLLANLAHQAITSPIIVNIQQGLAGTGSGPGGGINWPQLGADIGQFLSIIAGAQIGGGGIFANVGAIAGALGGQALGQGLGWWLGTLGGPIGMALGSVLGGIVGGILDDLLGSDRPAELNLAGNQRYAGLSSSDTEGIIKSLFGETFLTTRRIDSQALGQISQGLQEFDNAIAGFLSAGQIGLITDALANWNIHLSGEAINMETLLGSRFAVILSTFTQDIQDFVNRGEDLTSQIDRLQIGVGVQNIMDAAPDLFSGRTTADFLAVVTAFQDGTETITDAFNEVIALLDIIVVAQASLRDFADSDLGSDFEALMTDANITLTEAVAGMNAAVMDAINNFDGSPDQQQLRNIALMVTGIREGELKLLAQIDSIQKGINTNLDKLKADILGVTEEPKTAQELADQARGLIAQVSLATSPGEIAALAQQFEALIRQISPEDQALMQDQLLGLIDRFQTASDDALDLQRQATLDNATAMRDLVDVFLTDIGDPLAILAASNQSAADALQAIADGTESTDLMMEHHGRTEQILDEGMDDISLAIGGIGPQVASAVRSAVQNVDVNVFVTVSDTDLVNE